MAHPQRKAHPHEDHMVDVIELTEEEFYEEFDRATREWVGLSADEFMRRWDAGEYAEIDDDPAHYPIMHLAGAAEFLRAVPSRSATERSGAGAPGTAVHQPDASPRGD